MGLENAAPQLCVEAGVEPIFPLGSRDLIGLITMPILHTLVPSFLAFKEASRWNIPVFHLVNNYQQWDMTMQLHRNDYKNQRYAIATI